MIALLSSTITQVKINQRAKPFEYIHLKALELTISIDSFSWQYEFFSPTMVN